MWFFNAKKRIYLDYASATPVLPEAALTMRRASATCGNPGAIHAEGVEAGKLLESAREDVARELGCKAREIVFVSGGTEANNLAILGAARKIVLSGGPLAKTHWIVSSIEHPSVLECMVEVERLGGRVSYVDPDARGVISVASVVGKLKKNTVFVSIGWANHEIGVIQPIRDIARAVHAKNPNTVVHVDAGQAPLYLSPQVHTLDVDLLTLDSGKLYGPRGVGIVYVGAGTEIAPVMLGGGQERGLRAGTENVSLSAGFAVALQRTTEDRRKEAERLTALRDAFAKHIMELIPSTVVNGDLERSLPHILNISIPNIQSEYMTLSLDREGVAISTKSACREGEDRRSHVVAMLGGEKWRAENTLRFSLGRDTNEHDIAKVASIFAGLVAKSA